MIEMLSAKEIESYLIFLKEQEKVRKPLKSTKENCTIY